MLNPFPIESNRSGVQNLQSNLTNSAILPEYVVHFLGANFEWQITDEEDTIDLWWKPDVRSTTLCYCIHLQTASLCIQTLFSSRKLHHQHCRLTRESD